MRCNIGSGSEQSGSWLFGISLFVGAFSAGLRYGRAPPISPVRATAPNGERVTKDAEEVFESLNGLLKYEHASNRGKEVHHDG